MIVMKDDNNSSVFRQLICEFESQIINFCLHEYCCRIVQRMFEYCEPKIVQNSANLIIQNIFRLRQNEFGVFVLSSMLENCIDIYKFQILSIIIGNAAQMALDKIGSQLVENSIKMIGKMQHQNQYPQLYQILDELISLPDDTNVQFQGFKQISFQDLVTRQYSNYVIQIAYEQSDFQRRQVILQKIQTTLTLNPASKDSYLRHILKYLRKFDVHVRDNMLQYGNQPRAMPMAPPVFQPPPQMPSYYQHSRYVNNYRQ